MSFGIRRFVAVDDCGIIINPMIVDGLIHDGLTMGMAPALMEEIVYDENGNDLSGTFMDCLLPTSVETSNRELDKTITPSPRYRVGGKIYPTRMQPSLTGGPSSSGGGSLGSGVLCIAFVASKRKFASRADYLRELGISDEEIAHIKAPAGLDIGAVTPDEITSSILAEIIQVRRQQRAPQKLQAAQAVAAVEELEVAEAQDVICGMMVESPTAKYTSEFRGEKFYFCCAFCKAQFDKNPEAVVRSQ